MAEVLSPPTEFAQSDDPFADLIPEGSGNLGVTPEQQNPFADLLKREDDLAPSAAGAYENLVGGGTPDAPAYQKVGENFSPVPRGVAVSTTDLGPFSDLVKSQEKPITNYAEQFGSFADLVPQSVAPATEGEFADHSQQWNERQRQMAEEAMAAGLPPSDTGNARLVDAIKRSQAAGYDFPNFSTTVDPTGDRTVTIDMENLVGALEKREAAATDPVERAKVAKEKAYWQKQVVSGGMTAEQWKAQTGEGDPVPPLTLRQRQMADIERGPLEALKYQLDTTGDLPLIPKERVAWLLENASPVGLAAKEAMAVLPDGPLKDFVIGAKESVSNSIAELSSPKNVALLSSLAGTPAFIQRAVTVGFSYEAAQGLQEAAKRIRTETDPKEQGRAWTDAVTSGAFMTAMFAHGALGLGAKRPVRGGGELRDAVQEPSAAGEVPRARQAGENVQGDLGTLGVRDTGREVAGEVTPVAPEAAPAEAPGEIIKADEATGQKIASDLGVEFRGVQKTPEGYPNMLMFEDPVAGGTVANEGTTVADFKAHLEQKRAGFAPEAEPPKVAEQFTPAPEVQELLKQAAPPEPAPEVAPAEPKLEPAPEFVPRDKKAPTAITVMNRKFVGKTEAEAWKAAHEELREEIGQPDISLEEFKIGAQQEKDFSITERPKPESDKDFARRQKEERSVEAGVLREQRRQGNELFKETLNKGGLPPPSSPNWIEDLRPLWETPSARRLFRKGAGKLDQDLRVGLEGSGFRFETVDKMLIALKERADTRKFQFAAGTLELGEAPEGGALFGRGGKRPGKPKPIGATPMGDKNFLRIPPGAKRIGKGLFLEGTRHTLGRVKNKVGQALGKATRRHVDVDQALFGEHQAILRKAFESVPRNRLDAAATEASQFIRDKENRRPTTPLQPDAQRILDAWYAVGKSTGDIARANNVQVWDAKQNKFRPMGTVKDVIPRMFSQPVEKVLKDPESNAPLFDQLANDLAAHRGITPEEAAAELREGIGPRFSSNDHFSNIEMARTEQLPESFYEYDIRNIAARYLPAFSERMAQIIAYGQRLGPRDAPIKPNLWDVARKEAQDTHTVEWLDAAEDRATGFHRKSPGLRSARRAQALGNATLLSDPTTTVLRNLLSGLSVTTERFGVGRSLMQMIKAGRELSRVDAKDIGVLRDDIGQFLGAEQLGETKLDDFIRSLQQKTLSVSGFSGSEGIVRAHGAAVASQFARDVAKALAKDPTSRLSREGLAQFKRTDVDAEKILAERGEWRTGEETRKFIRTSVRDSQGGYRFDQVPIWAESTAGRFLYQYGRWAIQRAGDIMRNTVKPALLGETVEFRGQRMRRRNVMPLMRLGFSVIGLGEAFAGIASGLFGRDRRDASFDEISEAFSEDEGRAVGLLAERITNDIIMAGTLGLISQPIDFIKSTKDQSRFKNPFEPPSLAGLKAVLGLAQKAYDQGGSLTKRDLLDASTALVRGAKNVTDVVRHQVGEQLYESQNDQRTLRNAAKRWAKEQGMDVSPASGFGDYRKSPRAPVFEAINDALLSGDAAEAKAVADQYVNSQADKAKARKAIVSSVEGKHPFKAGTFTADKYQTAFLAWSKTNLSEADQAQIQRVISLYDKTAAAAGLVSSNPRERQSLRTRHPRP